MEPEDLANPRGGRQALVEGLQRAGLHESDILSARRDPKTVVGYLELHIEQGLEFRSASPAQFERLKMVILDQAEQDARRFGLSLEVQFLGKRDPVETSHIAQAAILQAAQQLGLQTTALTSRAGHDAQALAAMCPVGMIFVPSVGGISHSPDELTEWQDCVNGANVLLQAVVSLVARL